MNKNYRAKMAAARKCFSCGGHVKKYKDGGMVTSVGDYVKGFDIIGEEKKLDTKPAKKMSDAEKRKMNKKVGKMHYK